MLVVRLVGITFKSRAPSWLWFVPPARAFLPFSFSRILYAL
jgi:hypothetical protein